MSICILTSDNHRHRFFCREIARNLKVNIIISEQKLFKPSSHASKAEEKEIITHHFNAREESERRFFSDAGFPDVPLLQVSPKEINTEKVLNTIKKAGVKLIIVYGCGIIGPKLINEYSYTLINMHLGLSPFYKGSGTNFWPIVNNEPQFCGATIHFIDQGIDTGSIISRVRAMAAPSDSIHSFGNKIIQSGTRHLINLLSENDVSGLWKSSFQQSTGGVTYYRRDFDAKAIAKANQNIKNGLFKNYTKTQFDLLKEIPIC